LIRGLIEVIAERKPVLCEVSPPTGRANLRQGKDTVDSN